MNRVNWKGMSSNFTEYVRIDEQLRLKQIHLAEFGRNMIGFSTAADFENRQHKRLIYQMRCYLYTECRKICGHPNMSKHDFDKLKESFIAPEKIFEADWDEIFYMEPTQRSLLISERADTLNSAAFYEKLISEVLGKEIPYSEKQHVIRATMERCLYRIC